MSSRRARTREEFWVSLIAGLLATLAVAWLLMLILGALLPQAGLSYLHTLLIIFGLRLLVLGVFRGGRK